MSSKVYDEAHVHCWEVVLIVLQCLIMDLLNKQVRWTGTPPSLGQ